MPLDPLHAEILRAVASLPGQRQIALAGGGAMIAHGLVDRVTTDVDLFTPDSREVGDLGLELAAVLRAHGHEVVEVRRESTFVRLNVVTSGGRQTAVEIAVDARLRPLVQLEVGPVLDQDELAADKILALFGRAAARDLVDVRALARRYATDALLRLAAEIPRLRSSGLLAGSARGSWSLSRCLHGSRGRTRASRAITDLGAGLELAASQCCRLTGSPSSAAHLRVRSSCWAC